MRTSKNTQLIFSQNKQYATLSLLKAVFDANPEQVKKILERTGNLKSKTRIILTKAAIKETHHIQKLNETGFKREWTRISPLEAAAWCGDIFLVRELLLHVSPTQKLDACNQLKGILVRTELEENGSFMAPYKALIKAYEHFNSTIVSLMMQRNPSGIDNNWHQVFLSQNLLPTYGLQEFCDDKSVDPVKAIIQQTILSTFDRAKADNLRTLLFTEEPKRSCYLRNGKSLDWDPIMEFGLALVKGQSSGAARGDWRSANGCNDHTTIKILCSVRTADLTNIIKELEGPKLSMEFDYDEKKEAPARS